MLVSIITSLYQSEKYILEFYQRARASALNTYAQYQIIFVNDGSSDASNAVVEKIIAMDPDVELIELSRNFGQHQAMLTGLRFAKGDHIFMIDCDLEEAPELLETFAEKLNQSPEIDFVFGVQRQRQKSFFSDFGGRLFYSFFNFFSSYKIPKNLAMARLLKKECVTALLRYPENQVFLGGLFEHIGFKRLAVEIDKGFKGQTSYNFRRKFNLMLDAVTSFSERPLKGIFVVGFFTWTTSLVYIGVVLYKRIFFKLQVGWPSLFASIWFFGGLILMVLGIIGIYLSKIYLEIKGRPLTIIKRHIKVISNEPQ